MTLSDGRGPECLWLPLSNVQRDPYCAARQWIDYIEGEIGGPHTMAKTPFTILKEILKKKGML